MTPNSSAVFSNWDRWIRSRSILREHPRSVDDERWLLECVQRVEQERVRLIGEDRDGRAWSRAMEMRGVAVDDSAANGSGYRA